jgi:hypothetical protein
MSDIDITILTPSLTPHMLRTVIGAMFVSECLADDERKMHVQQYENGCMKKADGMCEDCRIAVWAAQEAAHRVHEYQVTRRALERTMSEHVAGFQDHKFRNTIGRIDQCQVCHGEQGAGVHTD